MYVQLVSPNLNTVGNIGWCLSFVEDVFNTPHSFATATDAWNAVRSPHLDKNPPDVSVPIWYSYFENGINYGHVAVWVPGRGVLSSPYLRNGTSQWFKDIDECGRVLRCTYLGWSEDLAGVRIVNKGDDMIDKNHLNAVMRAFRGREANQTEKDEFVGKVTASRMIEIADDPNDAERQAIISALNVGEMAVKDNWQQQIADLQAQLAKQPAGIDIDTKAKIDQTSQDVGFIRALLNKIFK